MKNNYFLLKSVCLDVVKYGGNFALKYFKNAKDITVKKDKSYVTNLDLEIERESIKIIRKTFTDHNISGEEEDEMVTKSDYTWYVDPIDGTSNFIFGIPLFGSSVGLMYKNEIIMSAIYIPMQNLLFFASKKDGIFINNEKLLSEDKSDLSMTTLVVDCGKTAQAREDYATFLTTNGKKFRSIRQFGCVSSHAILLSSNNLNLSMIINAPAHDLYPLSLVYKMAGFDLFDRYGRKWTVESSDLIACKKSISNDVINCLKATSWNN